MAKRLRRLIFAVAALLILAAVLWWTPTGDYVILPGVTRNLDRIIQVQGVKSPPNGKMLMVAVDIEPANLLYYLIGRFTPYGEVIPAQQLLGGASEKQYEQMNKQMMDESHLMAKVAALQAIGYKNARETGKGALVYAILPNTPAQGHLKAQDVIVAIDGKPVHLAQDLLNYMGQVQPGKSVQITLLRGGQRLQMTLGTVKNPTVAHHAMIGAEIGTDKPSFEVPLNINIRTGDISGPSAGMMFSLAIINQLRPQYDLTRSGAVAGTGTIDAFGNVGAIGGVREKVITVYRSGAKVFLVPRGDYKDATAEAKAIGISQKMRIIPVGTLQQALAALRRQ